MAAPPPSVAELVSRLNLVPHPEGGFYAETFRDCGTIPDSPALSARGFSGTRCFSTAILFLLPTGAVSKLHRIVSAECWHHYLGDPLTVLQLDRSAPGHVRRTVLGPDLLGGQRVQHVVPGGCWFGALLTAEDSSCSAAERAFGYALVGCTVAPGFDFADFELATQEQMLAQFPDAADVVRRLT